MTRDETLLESLDWDEYAVLTPDDRAAVRSLAALCNAHDGTDLKLAYGDPDADPGDAATCFLARQDGRLVGYVGTDCGHVDEICGMVVPDLRWRGIASRLLARALSRSSERGQGSVLLIAEEAVPAGEALARSLLGKHVVTELRLGLHAPADLHADEGRAAGQVSLRPATEDDVDVMVEILASGFDEQPADPGRANLREEMRQARFFVGEVRGRAVGTLKVYSEEDASAGQRAGIYGFAVRAEDQGRGYGRAMLVQTLRLLLDEGYLPITLEVLRENDRARALYTSVGMRPITTYHYYRVALATEEWVAAGE